jgi:pectate lyase
MEEMNLTNHTYMIDAEDATCSKIINDYSDYIIYHKNSNNLLAQSGIMTPTTVCLSTNKTFVGEMTNETLSGFYGNCTGGKI